MRSCLRRWCCSHSFGKRVFRQNAIGCGKRVGRQPPLCFASVQDLLVGNHSEELLTRGVARLLLNKNPPNEREGWSAPANWRRKLKVLRPLAAHSDGEDLPPAGFQ